MFSMIFGLYLVMAQNLVTVSQETTPSQVKNLTSTLIANTSRPKKVTGQTRPINQSQPTPSQKAKKSLTRGVSSMDNIEDEKGTAAISRPDPEETVLLKRELDLHLGDLESVCKKKTLKDLEDQTKKLLHFLKKTLEKPNLDPELEILLSTILKTMESQEKSLSLNAFQLTYRLSFNLPEDITINQYSHPWAIEIETALSCVLGPNN